MNEKEKAIQEGHNIYQIMTDTCSVCGRRTPWRYIHNDKCQSCCALQAGDLYDIAVSANLLDPTNLLIEYRPDRMGRTRQPRKIDKNELDHINKCLQIVGEKSDLINMEYHPPVTTPETATARNLPAYLSPHYCIKRGHMGVRTIAGKCYFCQEERKIERANSPRQLAIVHGESHYLPINPCPRCGKRAPRRVRDSQCTGCVPKRVDSPRQQALRTGKEWYSPINPCPHCGKTVPRRVRDGQCTGCVPTRQPDSPRQQALLLGDKWYMPTNPCPRCGKRALKRVHDSVCSGCSSTIATPTTNNPASSSQWIADHSDMILDRALARTLGIKVYRTGRTCRHGNQGWKWVSTGNCVGCSNGNR